jgi:protein involved in polysaccharide export with SLBB domain
MFRLTTDGSKIDTTKLRIAVNRTARNYVIQPNDYLDVRVYTNKGERILDPNGELQFGQPSGVAPSLSRGSVAGTSSGGGGQRGGGSSSGSTGSGGTAFLVQADGTVTLPLVDRVHVSGLSLLQADSALRRTYNGYYKDAFVITRVTNNRVFVLGSPGGRVIPLENDNMNLIEVLSLAGGIDGAGGAAGLYRYGGRADNIRIIRGSLKNPQVQEIDLTTIEGMRRGNLQIEPNDIIYVDPVRRPVQEAITEAGPVISLVSLFAILYNTFRR